MGGAGAGLFAFDLLQPGVDHVADVVSGEDRNRVSAVQFGGGLVHELRHETPRPPPLPAGTLILSTDTRFTVTYDQSGTLSRDPLVIGPNATEAFGRFLYNQDTGDLLWDEDGTGAGAAILVATPDGAPLLTAAEISFVFQHDPSTDVPF